MNTFTYSNINHSKSHCCFHVDCLALHFDDQLTIWQTNQLSNTLRSLAQYFIKCEIIHCSQLFISVLIMCWRKKNTNLLFSLKYIYVIKLIRYILNSCSWTRLTQYWKHYWLTSFCLIYSPNLMKINKIVSKGDI